MSSNLASILCQNKLLTPEQQQKALALCQTENLPFTIALNNLDYLTYEEQATQISRLFSMQITDIDSFDYKQVCNQLALRRLIYKHFVLPIAIENNQLLIAVTDPTNSQIEDDFRFATQFRVKLCLAEHKAISAAIRRLYGKIEDEEVSGREIHLDELTELTDISSSETEESLEPGEDQAPVSRFITQVIEDAIRKGASDIHFEPYENSYRIRFRCDGILVEVQRPATQLARRLAARIKILSKLDISERRIPQDGRIKIKAASSKPIDLRVSTLPTLWGEKIVLRILDGHQANLDINQLGYNQKQIALYQEALRRPQGMILVTGPTGSGKTVSLYTGLNILNTPERNISTAEDPVEINLPGVNQVQINRKIDFDFSQALRAFLRQDPDVVMVGEIRDTETAEIAVKAAQTGHQVLSTLHTNSAAETITRLGNLGIAGFDIASSLNLIIAQRLVRLLCPHCKQKEDSSPERLNELGIRESIELYKASSSGCNECIGGYLGRTGIYEVMACSEHIKRLISLGVSSAELEAAARSGGMQTLKEAGIEKLSEGITSYAELQRVL